MTITETPTIIEPQKQSRRRGLREMRSTLLVVGGLLAASVVAVGIAYAVKSSGPAGDAQASTVEYAIRMPTTLAAAKHEIGLTNDGTIDHELVLFKTDLPANALPLSSDGDIDEEASQLTNVGDSGKPLKAGGTETFKTAVLSPGHYVAVCNLPGHYKLGMKLNVTVR